MLLIHAHSLKIWLAKYAPHFLLHVFLHWAKQFLAIYMPQIQLCRILRVCSGAWQNALSAPRDRIEVADLTSCRISDLRSAQSVLSRSTNKQSKLCTTVFAAYFFASSFLTILFWIVFTDFFANSLNLETKIDYLIKRQKQCTIFDYLLNSQIKSDVLKFDYLSNGQKR